MRHMHRGFMENLGPHALGVLATAILVATLGAQTIKQWHERATIGIPRWSLLGHICASACFVSYSLLIHSVLFAIANGLILMSAIAGYVVLRLNRRRVLRQSFGETALLRHGAMRPLPDGIAETRAPLRVVMLG